MQFLVLIYEVYDYIYYLKLIYDTYTTNYIIYDIYIYIYEVKIANKVYIRYTKFSNLHYSGVHFVTEPTVLKF